MMTHDEMIAVIQAHKEGKVIQHETNKIWYDNHCPSFNFDNCTFRVKPEPKLRPWKPKEVPMPCLLRTTNGQIRWLILAVSSVGIATANSQTSGNTCVVSFQDVCNHNEHSTDGGKTWKPCGIEE